MKRAHGLALVVAVVGATCAHRAVAAEERGPSFAEDAPDDIRGEIAVDLLDDATSDDIAAVSARYGLTLRPNSGFGTTHDKIEIADVDPTREAEVIDALSRDPRVQHVEPMSLYHALFVPNDPLYEKQWHLRRVGAEQAWNYSCGLGIVVAVVDTGVACFDEAPLSKGSDLAGTRCVPGWNFVDDSVRSGDDQGHGTHVAGTIAQTTNNGMGASGLAHCAALMPVKVLTKQGFGTVANVAEGIRFAADQGAQVINLSLGGPFPSAILQDAVNHALSRGVVVVAAAGNSGRSVGWPAAYPGVIAVSATDDKDTIAWFSSRGPQVFLAAPGVGVTQQTICNGGRDKCELFATFNGTSMAAPHVAAAAAMIESLGVTRAHAVLSLLSTSARPGATSDRNLYGAGVLDVSAAVSRAFWGRVFGRALALVAAGWWIVRRIRKRGGTETRAWRAIAAALLCAVGLVPVLPLFDAAAWVGRWPSLRWLIELAMRPLGEWDLVVAGVGVHSWLVLGSALPAMLLTMLGFSSAKMRPVMGGVALGTAAFLLQTAWSADSSFVGGVVLGRAWALANAAICLWLARFGLDQSGAGGHPG